MIIVAKFSSVCPERDSGGSAVVRAVILKAVAEGAYTGYQAVLVEIDTLDPEFDACGDVYDVGPVLRQGPFCNALLVARSRAIDWAAELGERYTDDPEDVASWALDSRGGRP